MAYYAALVSLVELLKEMSLSEYQYPKYLFQKQQITRVYEKFSLLQVLLDDYSPTSKEADGFLEGIRDVACRLELLLDRQTSDAACRERLTPDAASREGCMPDAASEEKCMIESQISDQVREPNCLAEIIRLFCCTMFVSAYHNTEPVNEEVVQIMIMANQFFLEQRELLRQVVEIGYDDSEKLKREADLILGDGYLDVGKLKEEIDSIAINGNQEWAKMKKEVDAVFSKGYQDLERVEQLLHSIVIPRYHDSEWVKEEVDSVIGKGFDDLLEKVMKKEVDPIVEELMMRIKDKSHKTRLEDLQVTLGRPNDDGTTMVVLDENPTTIKAQLFRDSSKLEVISIVGMGGIGKTTLARHIFYDKLINDRFDFRVWVTVSQSYHLPNILRDIANSLNISKEDVNEERLSEVWEHKLKESIYKHLFGRRYLIIMDDVWDTKILKDVKWIFPDDKRSRSRIMITTRQSNVASIASESDFINQIPTLTHDQSWILFSEKMHCPPELEDIGRSIVKNCRGLPLAIVVVAGLLSKISKTWDHWGDIARQVSSTAAENDEHFSNILSLSYDHLPHHLKPCFLYLGGFPEDYEISISRLVKLWVAEGFLKPVASKCLEEAAEEYLEELVKRNLVLIAKRRSNGKFKSCIMHDLLRDLCLEKARHEHFLLLPHKHIATDHTHRFFIHPDSSSDIDMQKNNVCHVRSIISFGDAELEFISHPSSYKPLRVLDAPYTRFSFKPVRVFDPPYTPFSFLHDGVLELLNLRFLVLIYPMIDIVTHPQIRIPSSIPQLQHLQTLIVHSSSCSEIFLSAYFWIMAQLRHVQITNLKLQLPLNFDSDRNMSNGLPFLQTLSTPVNFKFTFEIVEMIPSIKKLKLKYTHHDAVWRKFELKNLFHLHQIETLALKIISSFHRENVAEPFPEGFAFPSNLRKLTLEGCKLPWRNMTIVGKLPHLQVLKLRKDSFLGTMWESNEEEFSRLKFLGMYNLSGMKNWLTESSHFPSLEHIVIEYCRDLEGIPLEVGEFPNLKLIEVWSESEDSRVKASALDIQEEQSSVGNEALQVRVYSRDWSSNISSDPDYVFYPKKLRGD